MNEEFAALRSEILCWIQVQFALHGVSVTVVAATLATTQITETWITLSAVLLGFLACMGLLSAFTINKIVLTSTYLNVYHQKLCDWDRRLQNLEASDFGRKFVHFSNLLVLYAILGVGVVFYPWSAAPSTRASAVSILFLGANVLLFGYMLFSLAFRLATKDVCEKWWHNMKERGE